MVLIDRGGSGRLDGALLDALRATGKRSHELVEVLAQTAAHIGHTVTVGPVNTKLNTFTT